MWATYLCFTTLFLHISIMKLVYEYMEYAVNIQTYNDVDAPMAFPTVTFCNHQPFSARAYELCSNKSLISPTRFNQLIRQVKNMLLISAPTSKCDN
uniref:Amiloride sensitive sodium channel n=1 Tax=Echinococcus granulosus TaxID=6210 RepID=A0A068WYZ8_ECHGR|nr:amiloride sensitive sodium channel [Echinococcus granulosus]